MQKEKLKKFSKWLLSLTLTIWLSYGALQAWNWLVAEDWDVLSAVKWNELVSLVWTKADISAIPDTSSFATISQIPDVSWYITNHQDISGKANSSEVYTKTDLYTKTEIDALIASLQSQILEPDWTVQDSNCSLPDVTIGSQTWAGCNSTLWIWIDYTPWHCYNYAWTNNWSNCGWYSSKESDYNSVWVDNIWGKLYTWDNAQNACGTWYHLPSIEEWTTAMISLGCTDTVSSTTTWWKCAWLWWKNNGTLKDKLKLPIAGFRNTDGVSFNHRGNYTRLWASSVSGSGGRWVTLGRYNDTVLRRSRGKAYGFSVRCIKD